MQEPFIMALRKCDQIKMRGYMDRRLPHQPGGTSTNRVTSPTWGPPDLHVNSPLDPVTNYMAGAFYLRSLTPVTPHVIGSNRLINEHDPITKSHVSFL